MGDRFKCSKCGEKVLVLSNGKLQGHSIKKGSHYTRCPGSGDRA